MVDGARGLDKVIATCGRCAVQRCTVHKHRNLFAHAPERLHDEITADYNDMIYAATCEEIEARARFHRKWRLKHARCDSLEEAATAVHLHTTAASQWRSARTTNAIERLHEEFKRRIKTQTVLRPRTPPHAILGVARIWPDQHAQGRWLADTYNKTYR